jgi:hypothetical protein
LKFQKNRAIGPSALTCEKQLVGFVVSIKEAFYEVRLLMMIVVTNVKDGARVDAVGEKNV